MIKFAFITETRGEKIIITIQFPSCSWISTTFGATLCANCHSLVTRFDSEHKIPRFHRHKIVAWLRRQKTQSDLIVLLLVVMSTREACSIRNKQFLAASVSYSCHAPIKMRLPSPKPLGKAIITKVKFPAPGEALLRCSQTFNEDL